MTTPNVELPEFGSAGTPDGTELTRGMRRLDAVVQLAVLGFSTTPPASPKLGDRYIIQATATGAWAGRERHIAVWTQDGWVFVVPRNGWIAAASTGLYVFDETIPAWTVGLDYISPATSKGDLLVRGDSALARLPVGTNGQILVADSSVSLGMRWDTGAGGTAVVISVVDYGATGDGSDQTTAVQDAIDAAETIRATAEADAVVVWFPAGQYTLDPVYVRSSGISLIGDGPAATYLTRKAGTASNTDSLGVINFHGASTSRLMDVGLARMSIDGNKANITITGDQFDVECVSYIHCIRPRVYDVNTTNASAEGLDFDDCDDGLVVGCYGEGCGGCAIHFSLNCVRMRAIGCAAYDCGRTLNRGGFDVFSSASRCSYVGCVARECYRGFVISGDNNTVSDCQATDNDANGYRLIGHHNVLSGSHASGDAGNGVTVEGDRNTITGCQSRDNTSIGFAFLNGALNNIISASVANGNGSNGLRFFSGSNNNIAVGNQLGGNTGTSYNNLGSGNTSTANHI